MLYVQLSTNRNIELIFVMNPFFQRNRILSDLSPTPPCPNKHRDDLAENQTENVNNGVVRRARKPLNMAQTLLCRHGSSFWTDRDFNMSRDGSAGKEDTVVRPGPATQSRLSHVPMSSAVEVDVLLTPLSVDRLPKADCNRLPLQSRSCGARVLPGERNKNKTKLAQSTVLSDLRQASNSDVETDIFERSFWNDNEPSSRRPTSMLLPQNRGASPIVTILSDVECDLIIQFDDILSEMSEQSSKKTPCRRGTGHKPKKNCNKLRARKARCTVTSVTVGQGKQSKAAPKSQQSKTGSNKCINVSEVSGNISKSKMSTPSIKMPELQRSRCGMTTRSASKLQSTKAVTEAVTEKDAMQSASGRQDNGKRGGTGAGKTKAGPSGAKRPAKGTGRKKTCGKTKTPEVGNFLKQRSMANVVRSASSAVTKLRRKLSRCKKPRICGTPFVKRQPKTATLEVLKKQRSDSSDFVFSQPKPQASMIQLKKTLQANGRNKKLRSQSCDPKSASSCTEVSNEMENILVAQQRSTEKAKLRKKTSQKLR